MYIKCDIAELYIEPPKVPLKTSKITDARYYAEVELVDGRTFSGYVEEPSYTLVDTNFVSIRVNDGVQEIHIEGYKV